MVEILLAKLNNYKQNYVFRFNTISQRYMENDSKGHPLNKKKYLSDKFISKEKMLDATDLVIIPLKWTEQHQDQSHH